VTRAAKKSTRPVASWDAFIRRIDLSRFPCKIDISIRISDRHVAAHILEMKLHVKDIFSDAMSTVHHLWGLPPFERLTDTERLKAICGALAMAFRHEIEECLWLDGARVFDPHKDQRFHSLAGVVLQP